MDDEQRTSGAPNMINIELGREDVSAQGAGPRDQVNVDVGREDVIAQVAGPPVPPQVGRPDVDSLAKKLLLAHERYNEEVSSLKTGQPTR